MPTCWRGVTLKVFVLSRRLTRTNMNLKQWDQRQHQSWLIVATRKAMPNSPPSVPEYQMTGIKKRAWHHRNSFSMFYLFRPLSVLIYFFVTILFSSIILSRWFTKTVYMEMYARLLGCFIIDSRRHEVSPLPWITKRDELPSEACSHYWYPMLSRPLKLIYRNWCSGFVEHARRR